MKTISEWYSKFTKEFLHKGSTNPGISLIKWLQANPPPELPQYRCESCGLIFNNRTAILPKGYGPGLYVCDSCRDALLKLSWKLL